MKQAFKELAEMAESLSPGMKAVYEAGMAMQEEINELKAHVERLRNALDKATDGWIEDSEYDVSARVEFVECCDVLGETPSQSLRHIESRVEEETISDFTDYLVCARGADVTTRDVEQYKRKYKTNMEEEK